MGPVSGVSALVQNIRFFLETISELKFETYGENSNAFLLGATP